jgi:hypothetical protein
MFEFISKKVKPSELKSDMKGDKPAFSKARIAQTSKATKRKRKADSDEESTESESTKPPPLKSAASRAVAGSSRTSAAGSSSKAPTFLGETTYTKIVILCYSFKNSCQIEKHRSSEPQSLSRLSPLLNLYAIGFCCGWVQAFANYQAILTTYIESLK